MASSTVMGLRCSVRNVFSGRRFSSTWAVKNTNLSTVSSLEAKYCGENLLATSTPPNFKSCGGNQWESLTAPKPPKQTEPSAMLSKLEEELGFDGSDGPLHWPWPTIPDSYWHDYDDNHKENLKVKFGQKRTKFRETTHPSTNGKFLRQRQREKQSRLSGSVAVPGVPRRKSSGVFGCEPSAIPSRRSVNKIGFDDFKIHSPSAKVSKVVDRASRVGNGRDAIPPASNGRRGCFGLSDNKSKIDGEAVDGFDGRALPLPLPEKIKMRPRMCDEIRKKLSQLNPNSEYIYVPTVGLGASIEHLIGLDEFDGREGLEPPTVCTCIIPKNAVFSTQMPVRRLVSA